MADIQMTYGFRDRTEWPSGLWDDEPDRMEWRDGPLVCLALRNHHGVWCGYVGVPEGHPWFGKSYTCQCVEYTGLQMMANLQAGKEPPEGYHTWNQDCPTTIRDVDVHGGVTYGERCMEGEGPDRICHVAQDGEPHRWWIGFDCGHGGDESPGMLATNVRLAAKCLAEGDLEGHRLFTTTDRYEVYRDSDYIINEVSSLATQAHAAQLPDWVHNKNEG